MQDFILGIFGGLSDPCFGFFINKFFHSLLGKTVVVVIASFCSCETTFEEKRDLTLLESLLFPSCELVLCLNLFWCEFSGILAIGHDVDIAGGREDALRPFVGDQRLGTLLHRAVNLVISNGGVDFLPA